jgi:hypothetical protein
MVLIDHGQPGCLVTLLGMLGNNLDIIGIKLFVLSTLKDR